MSQGNNRLSREEIDRRPTLGPHVVLDHCNPEKVRLVALVDAFPHLRLLKMEAKAIRRSNSSPVRIEVPSCLANLPSITKIEYLCWVSLINNQPATPRIGALPSFIYSLGEF